MVKRICLAAATVALLSSGATAQEYYLVQETATKKCKIVESRPTETTWVQVGPLAFKTRTRRRSRLRSSAKKRTDHPCLQDCGVAPQRLWHATCAEPVPPRDPPPAAKASKTTALQRPPRTSQRTKSVSSRTHIPRALSMRNP
jgi:hypothetical protein